LKQAHQLVSINSSTSSFSFAARGSYVDCLLHGLTVDEFQPPGGLHHASKCGQVPIGGRRRKKPQHPAAKRVGVARADLVPSKALGLHFAVA